MKLRLTFKTTEVVDRVVDDYIDAADDPSDWYEAEQEVRDSCSQWVKHGEYLTVEVDTVENTCVVIPCVK